MSTKRFSPKGNLLLYHVGAAVAVIGWGVSFISTKVLLDNGLHPIEIYIYRFAIAYSCDAADLSQKDIQQLVAT